VEAFERAEVGVRLGTTTGPNVGAPRLAFTTPAIRGSEQFRPSRCHWYWQTAHENPREVAAGYSDVTVYAVNGHGPGEIGVSRDWWTSSASEFFVFSVVVAP